MAKRLPGIDTKSQRREIAKLARAMRKDLERRSVVDPQSGEAWAGRECEGKEER